MSLLKQKIEHSTNLKQSNLVISLDLTDAKEVLEFIEKYCNDVFGIKLHSDIINYDSVSREKFLYNLMLLKQKYNFIIIEDRKFCDIGNTVKLQSGDITKYSDLITVHAIPGEGIIDGLRDNCINNNCGILLISQMSSKSNLISKDYTENVKKMALDNHDVVVGFICQEKMCDNMFHFSPGVKLSNSAGDGLGQKYSTPLSLYQKGINFFIVGRDIYESLCPAEDIDRYNNFYKQYMTNNNILKKNIIEAGVIKTGSFTLSSGETSTVYADFRLLNSNPNVLKMVAKEFTRHILMIFNGIPLENLVLMGVPMGGISLATAISLNSGIPFVILRDKRKEYGSKNLIEGMSIDDLKTKTIILVEDVVTTGGSVEKIINKAKTEEGLKVGHVFCILDRGKKGDEYITNTYGIPVSKLFSLSDF
jgi:uridine monophosphate synthetase